MTKLGPKPEAQKQAPGDLPSLSRVLRKRDLPAVVGVSRTAIEAMIEAGEFPKPIRINDHARILGWLESEIIAWQQQRRALRDSGRAPRPKYRPVPPRPDLLTRNRGPKKAGGDAEGKR